MGKYGNLVILKQVKARVKHTCYGCGKEILPGEIYYREHIEDKFLHIVHAKAYCSFCGDRGVRPARGRIVFSSSQRQGSLLNLDSCAGPVECVAAGGEHMEDFRQYYHLESYLFDTVRPRFLAQGYLDAFDFFCIVIWKAERAKGRIARRLANVNEDLDTAVKVVTWRISQQATSKERMRVLWNGGLELPMVSAILTVLYPDEFTVYDERVCGQLGKYHSLRDSRDFETLWNGYQDFKRDVQTLAPAQLSLRDADRYLWGKSFRDQLLNDIRSGFKRTKEG